MERTVRRKSNESEHQLTDPNRILMIHFDVSLSCSEFHTGTYYCTYIPATKLATFSLLLAYHKDREFDSRRSRVLAKLSPLLVGHCSSPLVLIPIPFAQLRTHYGQDFCPLRGPSFPQWPHRCQTFQRRCCCSRSTYPPRPRMLASNAVAHTSAVIFLARLGCPIT